MYSLTWRLRIASSFRSPRAAALAGAAAEQDRERLARLAAAGQSGLRRTGAEVALHAVEVGVDLFAPLGLASP